MITDEEVMKVIKNLYGSRVNLTDVQTEDLIERMTGYTIGEFTDHINNSNELL